MIVKLTPLLFRVDMRLLFLSQNRTGMLQFLCKRGVVVARVLVGFLGEEKSFFFLSMHLYPFLNVVGCV
jgi:hypothetical protein